MIEAIHDYLARTWRPAGNGEQNKRPTKTDASRIVESILGIMKDTLAQGQAVKVRGFGNFQIRQKHPRKGRNPQSGEAIVIAARKALTFFPSHILRKALNPRQGGKIEQK
jgi:integration host factor subunit alpha